MQQKGTYYTIYGYNPYDFFITVCNSISICIEILLVVRFEFYFILIGFSEARFQVPMYTFRIVLVVMGSRLVEYNTRVV